MGLLKNCIFIYRFFIHFRSNPNLFELNSIITYFVGISDYLGTKYDLLSTYLSEKWNNFINSHTVDKNHKIHETERVKEIISKSETHIHNKTSEFTRIPEYDQASKDIEEK